MKDINHQYQSFSVAFFLSSLLIINYAQIVKEVKHQEEVWWSHTDTLSLIFLQILLTGLVFLLLALFKFKLNKKLCDAGLLGILALNLLIYGEIIYNTRTYTASYINKEKPEGIKNESKNVFLIVLDMLSYQQLYLKDGESNPPQMSDRYKNLKDLSKESINHHAIFSPYDFTRKSMPKILSMDLKNKESELVKTFNDQGFKTMLVGYHLNYCDLITNLSYCEVFQKFKLKSKLHPFINSTLKNLSLLPISGVFSELKIAKKFYLSQRYQEMILLSEQVESSFIDLVKNETKNNENHFFILHFPLPHPQYSFTKEGPRSTESIKEVINNQLSHKKGKWPKKAEYYRDNMDYTDLVMESFIKTLKDLKLYDQSLIIITGDHSLRKDPDFRDIDKDKYSVLYHEKTNKKKQKALDTHVPFIVKAPGNKYDNDFELNTNDQALEFISKNLESRI